MTADVLGALAGKQITFRREHGAQCGFSITGEQRRQPAGDEPLLRKRKWGEDDTESSPLLRLLHRVLVSTFVQTGCVLVYVSRLHAIFQAQPDLVQDGSSTLNRDFSNTIRQLYSSAENTLTENAFEQARAEMPLPDLSLSFLNPYGTNDLETFAFLENILPQWTAQGFPADEA